MAQGQLSCWSRTSSGLWRMSCQCAANCFPQQHVLCSLRIRSAHQNTNVITWHTRVSELRGTNTPLPAVPLALEIGVHQCTGATYVCPGHEAFNFENCFWLHVGTVSHHRVRISLSTTQDRRRCRTPLQFGVHTSTDPRDHKHSATIAKMWAY